jgi:hypothetical protein
VASVGPRLVALELKKGPGGRLALTRLDAPFASSHVKEKGSMPFPLGRKKRGYFLQESNCNIVNCCFPICITAGVLDTHRPLGAVVLPNGHLGLAGVLPCPQRNAGPSQKCWAALFLCVLDERWS